MSTQIQYLQKTGTKGQLPTLTLPTIQNYPLEIPNSNQSRCDLCREYSDLPTHHAHKPYLFRFFHQVEYQQQVKYFHQRKLEIDAIDFNNNKTSDVTIGDTTAWKDDSSGDGDEDDEELEYFEAEIEDEIFAEEDEYEILTEEDDDENGDEDDTEANFSIEIAFILDQSRAKMDKQQDISMVTSAALASGLSNMTSLNDTATKYICAGFATMGLTIGIRGLLAAVQNHSIPDPECANCNKKHHLSNGCRPFCSQCGELDQADGHRGSYWKDGCQALHCLVICERCHSNCVLCEKNVATVFRHHGDFSRGMHGRVTSRLGGGFYRDGGVVGSVLLIGGILCSALPGVRWELGLALVAGSILASASVRLSSCQPTLVLTCTKCGMADEASEFLRSSGCQKWCDCCGVMHNDGEEVGERYCLQLCQPCSSQHD